jgi:hypothetical protein
MGDLPPDLVIRRRAPLRRTVLTVAIALLGLLALYIVYELGRYDAGYDRQAAAQERTELEVHIDKLEKSNRELRTHLAELDTVKVGAVQERAELSRTIGELQAQVARQTQELAFYRGVVAEGDTPIGVKIEQLRITATDRPDRFHIHLTLLKTARADANVSGSVSLAVEGESQGAASRLDMAGLTEGKLTEQSFNFRYFETLDQEVMVPVGFHAERVTVEVRVSRKEVAPLTQSFLWRVDAL